MRKLTIIVIALLLMVGIAMASDTPTPTSTPTPTATPILSTGFCSLTIGMAGIGCSTGEKDLYFGSGAYIDGSGIDLDTNAYLDSALGIKIDGTAVLNTSGINVAGGAIGSEIISAAGVINSTDLTVQGNTVLGNAITDNITLTGYIVFTPSVGNMVMYDRDGTKHYLWIDALGDLNVSTSAAP